MRKTFFWMTWIVGIILVAGAWAAEKGKEATPKNDASWPRMPVWNAEPSRTPPTFPSPYYGQQPPSMLPPSYAPPQPPSPPPQGDYGPHPATRPWNAPGVPPQARPRHIAAHPVVVPARLVTMDVVAVLLSTDDEDGMVSTKDKPMRLSRVAHHMTKALEDAEGAPDVVSMQRELGVSSAARMSYSARLTAREGHKVRIQSGERQYQIRGFNETRLGSGIQSIPQDVGMIVEATPAMCPGEMIGVTLSFEASFLGPEEEGMTITANRDGKPVRMRQTHTVKVDTRVVARDRQTVVAHQGIRRVDGKTELLLILVRPSAGTAEE